MTVFVALVHGRPGGYGISYPDFSGATSLGETMEETMVRATEGLSSHVEAMTDLGLALPQPRGIEELKADPDHAESFRDAVAVASIDVEMPGGPVRLNVSMDESLIQDIDRRAKFLGESRSKFLATAARHRLAEAETN